MQLSHQTIRILSLENSLICPFQEHYQHGESGLSGGLSCAGYDVHVADIKDVKLGEDRLFNLDVYDQGDYWLIPQKTGVLGVTLERFKLPEAIAMTYYNKSTLARWFIEAAATLGEPGWEGHLTLELYNASDVAAKIYKGQPIGQVVFNMLDQPSEAVYSGKYQNQKAEPVQGTRYKEAS